MIPFLIQNLAMGGGSGAYVLTADAGSFTLSGQAAGLLAARTISASTGSFTLSGQDAGFLAGRVLAASAGSFTLTGIAAVLDYSGANLHDRDRDIRSAIRDLLVATNAFDNAYLTGVPESRGYGSSDTRSVTIDPVKEDYQIDADYAGAVLVHGTVRITFIAREDDDQLADEACERLFNLGCNALNGQSLDGLTFPGFTRITRAKWERRQPPERRKSADLEYRYLVDTWVSFGTDD